MFAQTCLAMISQLGLGSLRLRRAEAAVRAASRQPRVAPDNLCILYNIVVSRQPRVAPENLIELETELTEYLYTT